MSKSEDNIQNVPKSKFLSVILNITLLIVLFGLAWVSPSLSQGLNVTIHSLVNADIYVDNQKINELQVRLANNREYQIITTTERKRKIGIKIIEDDLVISSIFPKEETYEIYAQNTLYTRKENEDLKIDLMDMWAFCNHPKSNPIRMQIRMKKGYRWFDPFLLFPLISKTVKQRPSVDIIALQEER